MTEGRVWCFPMSCYTVICRINCKMYAITTCTSFLLQPTLKHSYIIYIKEKVLYEHVTTFSSMKKDFEFNFGCIVICSVHLPQNKKICSSLSWNTSDAIPKLLREESLRKDSGKDWIYLVPVLRFLLRGEFVSVTLPRRSPQGNLASFTWPETNWPRKNVGRLRNKTALRSAEYRNVWKQETFKRFRKAPSLN